MNEEISLLILWMDHSTGEVCWKYFGILASALI